VLEAGESLAPERVLHVFVCYGSVSFDAALRIAASLGVEPASLVFLLLFRAPQDSLPNGARTYQIDARSYSEWSKAFRIAAWYRRVLSDFGRTPQVGIVAYLPHPFELPANDLAYSNRQVVRRELLPDGMLNFTRVSVLPSGALERVRYLGRVALRMLAARAWGYRYRPLLSGSLTQVDCLAYDRAWHDGSPGFLGPQSGLTLLPGVPRAPSDAPRTGTLILDQELGELMDAELEAKVRRQLLELVESRTRGPLYYKAHPRGQSRLASFPPGTLDRSSLLGVEMLLDELVPECIVGFYSTPLLRAVANAERVAVLPARDARGVRKPELLAQVDQALADSGATLIRVS
jgi:hypothetical protein